MTPVSARGSCDPVDLGAVFSTSAGHPDCSETTEVPTMHPVQSVPPESVTAPTEFSESGAGQVDPRIAEGSSSFSDTRGRRSSPPPPLSKHALSQPVAAAAAAPKFTSTLCLGLAGRRIERRHVSQSRSPSREPHSFDPSRRRGSRRSSCGPQESSKGPTANNAGAGHFFPKKPNTAHRSISTDNAGTAPVLSPQATPASEKSTKAGTFTSDFDLQSSLPSSPGASSKLTCALGGGERTPSQIFGPLLVRTRERHVWQDSSTMTLLSPTKLAMRQDNEAELQGVSGRRSSRDWETCLCTEKKRTDLEQPPGQPAEQHSVPPQFRLRAAYTTELQTANRFKVDQAFQAMLCKSKKDEDERVRRVSRARSEPRTSVEMQFADTGSMTSTSVGSSWTSTTRSPMSTQQRARRHSAVLSMISTEVDSSCGSPVNMQVAMSGCGGGGSNITSATAFVAAAQQQAQKQQEQQQWQQQKPLKQNQQHQQSELVLSDVCDGADALETAPVTSAAVVPPAVEVCPPSCSAALAPLVEEASTVRSGANSPEAQFLLEAAPSACAPAEAMQLIEESSASTATTPAAASLAILAADGPADLCGQSGESTEDVQSESCASSKYLVDEAGAPCFQLPAHDGSNSSHMPTPARSSCGSSSAVAEEVDRLGQELHQLQLENATLRGHLSQTREDLRSVYGCTSSFGEATDEASLREAHIRLISMSSSNLDVLATDASAQHVAPQKKVVSPRSTRKLPAERQQSARGSSRGKPAFVNAPARRQTSRTPMTPRELEVSRKVAALLPEVGEPAPAVVAAAAAAKREASCNNMLKRIYRG